MSAEQIPMTLTPNRLEGRGALVTGAGSGIGRATALRLAADGARVVALDRSSESVAATADLDVTGRVTAITGDVSRRSDLSLAIDQVVELAGSIDVLVNNAAVNLPALFHEASAEDIERTWQVNVMGAVHGCQLVIPLMLQQGRGSIVNIASVNALVAERFLSIYAASKGAIAMLTKGIALDYAGRGIRCNAVCPGWVDTPINHAHAAMLGGLEQVYATIDSFQPIGRPGNPSEIASLVSFLASDESSFMTGSVVVADGGMTAM